MRRLVVALFVAGLAMLFDPAAVAATPSQPPGALGASANWLRLSVGSLAPRMVTAVDTSVTVTGTITNISDRRISHLKVRLQSGPRVLGDGELRSSLSTTATFDQGITNYEPITDSLVPGQSASFTVSEPLGGAHSLSLDQAGVYPVLVNVQGEPDYSTNTQYRLAAASLLLPVVSAPGGQQAPPVAPSRLTVLWPLVDTQPRVLATAANGQLLLADDSLAASLAPGGRLFGLVDAVRQAAAGHPEVLDSLCFAVDPDLLDTVQGMTAGYVVRSGDGTAPGRGGAAAALWLLTLRGLTSGHCALALPYADADLAALTHAGGAALVRLAFGETATVTRTLGATSLADVAWPADGALDPTTQATLAGLGVNTLLLDPNAVTPQATGDPVTLGSARAVPIDQVTSGALAARGEQPNVDKRGIAAQNGIGAAVYRTMFDGGGRAVLIAPPRRWAPSAQESLAFLQALDTLLTDRAATAAPLAGLAEGAGGPSAALNYPPQVGVAEVAHPVAAGAVAAYTRQQDVLDAMLRDHTQTKPVLPNALIDPMRLGLLRAVSSAWRGGRGPAAQAALDAAESPFTALTGQVSVVQPTLPISLGSKDSKLPVTVVNHLPVDITVRIDLTSEAGLAPAPGPETRIPAGSSDTVYVPTKVTRSGRFSVYATLSTPGGTPLGARARFELVSNAYGTIILIVTGTAFGLLVLLSGRRIYRRVRSARAATEVGAVAEPGDLQVLDERERLTEPDQH